MQGCRKKAIFRHLPEKQISLLDTKNTDRPGVETTRAPPSTIAMLLK